MKAELFNVPIPALSSPRVTGADPASTSQTMDRRWRQELGCWALLLLVFNLPLVVGAFSTRYVFHPALVGQGEWWRLLTHPFVHVSWYHLALDAAAFHLSYVELKTWGEGRRAALLSMAALGSVAGAWVGSPLLATQGLCGLSGIAHGLTAVVSLECLRQ